MGIAQEAQWEQEKGLTYFTDSQARTVEAVCDRIIPTDETSAGATEAGVVYYIDRAITGFSTQLQPVYRIGIDVLDRWCRHSYGSDFVDLDCVAKDAVVRQWLGPEIPESDDTDQSDDAGLAAPLEDFGMIEGWTVDSASVLRRLFAVIREHTVEGFFCDPAYGGNRNGVGWRLVGFPGAQWGYTADQMKPGFESRSIVIKTLGDLRRELGTHDNNLYSGTDARV